MRADHSSYSSSWNSARENTSAYPAGRALLRRLSWPNRRLITALWRGWCGLASPERRCRGPRRASWVCNRSWARS